jgi:hypothetical protein
VTRNNQVADAITKDDLDCENAAITLGRESTPQPTMFWARLMISFDTVDDPSKCLELLSFPLNRILEQARRSK